MITRLALCVVGVVAWLVATAVAQAPPAVVLVTLDGARIEEMFGGVDAAVLRAQLKPEQRLEDHELYKRYWAATPQARREKLLPFFWGTLMRQHGSIAGNPALRSRVRVTNTTRWRDIRYDVYTARFAMDRLARHRPRVLHLAFDETDGWAHDRRDDRVLEAYVRTDRLLQELWVWLQSQPDYRGRTSLLITTDHGRGRTPADWHDHDEQIAGAGETWMGGDWKQFSGAAAPVRP